MQTFFIGLSEKKKDGNVAQTMSGQWLLSRS